MTQSTACTLPDVTTFTNFEYYGQEPSCTTCFADRARLARYFSFLPTLAASIMVRLTAIIRGSTAKSKHLVGVYELVMNTWRR